MSLRPRCLSPLLLAALAVPPAAAADEPVATVGGATPIVADAGWAAWRGDDSRLAVRAGDGPVQATSLRVPRTAPYDVGARRGGGAQVVWTENCSRRRRSCAVRAATLRRSGTLTAQTIAHIPYSVGYAPAIAVDGTRIAYGVRRGGCDVPYVRTLGGAARRLDRGHCGLIAQLDLDGGHVALLARLAVPSRTSEARVVRTGGGPSRTLQRESQGEESNYVGAIALDRGALYTARGGIRQANVFTRFRLATRARADARAFTSLQGAFARDGARTYYLQTASYESSTDCACLVVAGTDPFASAPRTLAPELSLTVAPQPVYVDSTPAAVMSLTRRMVSRTAEVGAPAGVAGVRVELLSAVPPTDPNAPGLPAPTPTGAMAVTGADGTATIALPGSPTPRRYLAAVTRDGVPIPTKLQTYVQTYARLAATASRLADGRLHVTGTISPAQPGRKVRLDRRLERICNQRVFPSGALTAPAQVGLPAGCFDRYTQDPVATADVSADGATYVIDAPATAPAGTYSVSLNSPQGPPVYAGETEGGVAAP